MFVLLAKEIIKENIIVISAVKSPILIVLNDKVSNSIDNPFWIWSIFSRTQKHGIPKEKIGGNKDADIAKKALGFFNSHPWESLDAGCSLHLFDFLLENFSKIIKVKIINKATKDSPIALLGLPSIIQF